MLAKKLFDVTARHNHVFVRANISEPLLASTSMGISEVNSACSGEGFVSFSKFHRLFPSTYRVTSDAVA